MTEPCPGTGDDGPVIHSDQLDYTPFPESVRLARHRAARLVTEWGHPEHAGDAALLVSEMATNALLHGCGTGRRSLIRVRLALTKEALLIAVSDPDGERLPHPRKAAPHEKFGRGLLLLSTLAGRWGTQGTADGKTVWCELDLSRPA